MCRGTSSYAILARGGFADPLGALRGGLIGGFDFPHIQMAVLIHIEIQNAPDIE